MDNKQLEVVLEKLPYMDGSGRRRFVTGGIILIGLIWLNWGSISSEIQVSDIEITDFLASPTLTFCVILMIYAIGSIVEMLGDLFLVRAASGVFWSFGFPSRKVNFKNKYLKYLARAALWLWAVPYIALFYVIRGFLGRTSYQINFENELSEDGGKVFKKLPSKVSKGLAFPVGNESDFAIKYLIDKFRQEPDRKWARRLITRAKDVSATTTSILILVFVGVFSNNSTEKIIPPEISAQVRSIQEFAYQLTSDASKIKEISAGNKLRQDFDVLQNYASSLEYSLANTRQIDQMQNLVQHLKIKMDTWRIGQVLKFSQSLEKKILPAPSLAPDLKKISDLLATLNEKIDKLWALIKKHKELELQEFLQLQSLLYLLLVFVLLVYSGFFTILRNGVVSILEAIALESETSDNAIDP